MDPSNQHLLGGARRAPMNQDEFDTKFNFLNECRTSSRRRYTLDSIVEQPQAVASDLCGGALNCWRRAAQRSISIVARPPQLASQQQQILNQQKASRQHKHISLASANSGSGGATNLPLPRYQLSNADEEAHLRDPSFYLLTHFPLIRVLQRYSFRKDLFGDFRAGLALALHSSAEGLAMAFLAGLPPICGLYSTFCASFLYLLFGTSQFSFMGTNLLICFLLRNIIERNALQMPSSEYFEEGTEILEGQQTNLEPMEIAATATFLCAIIQTSIYLLRLDFLFGFISEQIQGGFAMGVGMRIIFSQLGNVIQLKSNRICASELSLKEASLAIASNSVPSSTSSFPCIIWAYYRRLNGQKRGGTGLAVAQSQSLQNFSLSILANGSAIHRNNLAKSNPAASMGNSCLPSIWECVDAVNLNTLAVSISCIFLLIFTRQIIGPLTRFRLRSAVSSEFLLIILASFLSRIFNVESRWHLEIVKFPISSPFLLTFPKLSLTGQLFSDSLALAFLVYSLHLRSANSLSRMHKYKIDERQELFSMSLVNVLGSFFGAFPPGQSPLRISIGIRAGAKSMLANFWLILSLIPLILWAPHLFNALPVCVLSCTLLTQICPLFAGIARLPILWGISRLDVLTFCFTLSMALFSSNLCQALFGSIIFAAGTTLLRAQFPQMQNLVNVTGSGAYYAERCFYGSDLMDESGLAVIRFEAPILFHNVRYFKACVRESAARIKGQLLGIGIGTRTGSMKSMKSTNAQVIAGSVHNKDSIQMRSTLLISGDFVPNYENLIVGTAAEPGAINKVLILDFASVPYIDAQAISIMRELFEELAEKKCRLLFASVNSTIRTWFKLSGGFEHVPKHYFFPSVHDAVLCAQQMGGVIAPSIHMSVSLNGCRDLITLSNAASNHDLNLQSDTISAQTAGGITLAPNSECASASLGPFGGGGVPQIGPSVSSTSIRPISSPINVGFGPQNERETTSSNVSTPATIKPFCSAAMKKQPLKKSNS